MKIPSIRFFKWDDRPAGDQAKPSVSSANTRRIVSISKRSVRAPATAARTPEIVVERTWCREITDAASGAAGYASVKNVGALAERLPSATSAACDRIEFHELAMIDGVPRTRPPPDGLDIPARAVVDFHPEGHHFVFIGLKSPPRAGASARVALVFESSEKLSLDFHVGDSRTSSRRQLSRCE